MGLLIRGSEEECGMRQSHLLTITAMTSFIAVPVLAGAVPIVWTNQTPTRLVSAPSLGASDTSEKDYGWGDLDHDGDIDLVVVRKQPFTSPGKRPSVLFMNENGVLTDRTAQFASTAINVPIADQGFLTPTNTRDVALVDVNQDTWLDVVTATTISDGDPKHIGHPRVYMNQGSIGGVWQGLVFDNARIPAMLTASQGQFHVPQTPTLGLNPRFCSVAGGDVTQDGFPELYFGDYDASGAGGSGEGAGLDFNQKLLLNNGAGFFTDVTESRLTAIVNPGDGLTPIWHSAFGAAASIDDINNDGKNDIVFQTALNPPQYIGVAYNNTVSTGVFSQATVAVPPSAAPYFVSVADLNNDGRLDLIETDDGTDRYLLSTAIGGSIPSATFTTTLFPASTGGFGSQNIAADLNGDGFKDVLIADVDVDIGGCDRVADILINNGNTPNVTFTANNAIPGNMLNGTHHFAVFDINGDTWNDLVVGRCNTTEVWIFNPPAPPPCPTDLNLNLSTDGVDLGILLSQWLTAGSADFNKDKVVNGVDLGILLNGWGPCPQ
jgi:hypothetical protein